MYDFYWYPKCSTCQKAKAQLDEQGAKYDLIDLIKEPPTANMLLQWMLSGGFSVRKFFNTSGKKYRELGLKDKLAQMSVEEMAQLLASDGMLIKRPLIVQNDKLVEIGYSEEKYKRFK